MTHTQHFVHLRTCSNSHYVWELLASDSYIRIAPWVAISRSYFSELPAYERQRLRVLAAGKSVYKAIMISKSAARLWGLWVLPPFDEKIEMALQSKSLPVKAETPERYLYRKMTLPTGMLTQCMETRCTDVSRTCIDIARLHSFEEGLVAMDSALRQQLTTREQLTRTLTAMGRVKGAKNACLAIKHASALSESPFESYFRGIAIAEKLGRKIVPQFVIPPNLRADVCIDGAVVVEIDGGTKYDGSTYGKSAEQTILAERQREKFIQNQGLMVLRYSPRELLMDRERVVSEVRHALEMVQSKGSQANGPFAGRRAS